MDDIINVFENLSHEQRENLFGKHRKSNDVELPIFHLIQEKPPNFDFTEEESYEVWYVYMIDDKVFPAKKLADVEGRDIIHNTESVWDRIFVDYQHNCIINSKIVGMAILNKLGSEVWTEINDSVCLSDQEVWEEIVRLWPAGFYFYLLSQIYFVETELVSSFPVKN